MTDFTGWDEVSREKFITLDRSVGETRDKYVP
jgi:hypothetical protein